MKNWIKSKIFVAIIVIVILISSGFSIYLHGIKEFFKFNISSVFTWCIAIFITYLLGQKRIDERKSIDYCNDLVTQIFASICDNRFVEFSSQADIDFVRVQKEYLSNCISALEKVKKKYKIEKEIGYLKNEFDKYEELFDEHFLDISKLSNEKNLLQKRVNNIKKYCTDITANLYFDITDDKKN